MKSLMCTLGVGLLILFTTPVLMASDNSITVQDPWIREAPPTAMMLAAFLEMQNNDDRKRVLTGASSSSFDRVEIHKTEVSQGVATMRRQEKIEIPQMGRVKFETGGYHFMLIEPIKSLRAGDKVELSLSFQDGEQVAVEAEVRKGMPGMSGH